MSYLEGVGSIFFSFISEGLTVCRLLYVGGLFYCCEFLFMFLFNFLYFCSVHVFCVDGFLFSENGCMCV